MHRYISLLILVLVVSCYQVEGQELITDRPDQVESSVAVPKGSFQIESGILFGFAGVGTESIREFAGPSTLFRLGLFDGFEIRLTNQYEHIKFRGSSAGIGGISDMEIGAKIELLSNENSEIEIAFLSHLILPTGTSGISPEQYGTINKLAISYQVNESVGIGSNVGYDNFGVGNGNLTYAFVLGYGLTDKLGIFIETYGEVVEFEDLIANFDCGFTYLIKDNFQLDFSLGTGMNNQMNFISSGFSWIIHK